jgi:hypothetical protein
MLTLWHCDLFDWRAPRFAPGQDQPRKRHSTAKGKDASTAESAKPARIPTPSQFADLPGSLTGIGVVDGPHSR